MKALSLVHISHSKPFTNTLVIAEGIGLEHARVIKLVKKYQNQFQRLGHLDFQNHMVERRQGGGKALEYAELTEDQATFLITLFRNSDIVIEFKIQLVKAFRKALDDLERLRNRTSEPAWKMIRDETKVGFRWMTENLKEQRELRGKETKSVHYMVEAKLINAVLSGRFAGIDRNTLPTKDLSLIADLQRYNARLIAQDVPYAERKAMLISYLAPKIVGDVL